MTSTWRPWVIIFTVLGSAEATAETSRTFLLHLTHAMDLRNGEGRLACLALSCAPLGGELINALGNPRGMHDVWRCIVVAVDQGMILVALVAYLTP